MKPVIISLALLLSGCAATQMPTQLTDTMPVIKHAAAAGGIQGEFILPVKATGSRRNRVFLNTEADYRDQRNITIALSPEVARLIEQQHGKSAQEFFLNKTIKVKGTAKRVKITFFWEGKPTEKYYYQTHIRVNSPEQLSVAG